MQRILLLCFLMCSGFCLKAQNAKVRTSEHGTASTQKIKKALQCRGTNFIIVRHAEKELNGKDPALSVEGAKRAQKLSHLLKNLKIEQVLATQYLRTQQTAAPLAAAKRRSTRVYTAAESANTVRSLAESKENIVVVGHSNTLHLMLNALLQENYFKEFSEADYSHLFVVNVRKGRVKIHHFTY